MNSFQQKQAEMYLLELLKSDLPPLQGHLDNRGFS